jgi:hypothetical protein
MSAPFSLNGCSWVLNLYSCVAKPESGSSELSSVCVLKLFGVPSFSWVVGLDILDVSTGGSFSDRMPILAGSHSFVSRLIALTKIFAGCCQYGGRNGRVSRDGTYPSLWMEKTLPRQDLFAMERKFARRRAALARRQPCTLENDRSLPGAAYWHGDAPRQRRLVKIYGVAWCLSSHNNCLALQEIVTVLELQFTAVE